MLEKGVIQPSTLDWAACPVLVRKKMGASGIDYRGLKISPPKMPFHFPG